MKSLCVLCGVLFFQVMVCNAGFPLIIAHRGASHAAPENTLAAFKLAWEEGADGIEGDFHLTADGEVVCIHDADTKRVSGKSLVVAKTEWKELATLDVGSWKSPSYKDERIPRLGDVLAVLPPEKRFFLEIKGGSKAVGPIRRILENRHADPARVTLISFDAKVIRTCRRELPAYQAHWISDLHKFDTLSGDYLRQLGDCGSQGLQFDAKAGVDPAWLGKLRAKGLALTAWTVDDPKLAGRLIDMGIQNLTTNRPGPLRKALTE